MDSTGAPTKSDEAVERPRRSDARRNVGSLLEAAKAVFAESGVDAPAKEITDRAGVGVGTLYRHFPRRSDLVVAVLGREVDECVAELERLGAAQDPAAAVTGWIEPFTRFVTTKTGLAAALHSDDPAFAGLPERLLARVESVLAGLLTDAADAGFGRRDVSARHALLTVALICQPVPGESPAFNRHMAAVFGDGLRAAAGPGAAPTAGS